MNVSASASGVTCGSDAENCAVLGWEHVEKQLLGVAVCWMIFVLSSLFVSFNTKTSNLDSWKEQAEIKLIGLRSSVPYLTTNMVFSGIQCIFYCIRTYSRSMPLVFFLVDILACLIALLDAFWSWSSRSLQGIQSGLLFCFSQGIIESFIFPSVISVAVIEVGTPLLKPWFNFSFVASLRLFCTWQQLTETDFVNFSLLRWQFLNLFVSLFSLIIFATSTMQMFENLGDSEALQAMHHDSGWTFLSSFYYIFVTVSTVGYGDLAPITAFGRLFAIVTIAGGITIFTLSTHRMLEVLMRSRAGGGCYSVKYRSRHVVVTGTPQTQMLMTFLTEIFHADHADEADDMEVVIMLPQLDSTFTAITNFLKLKDNVHIKNRVLVIVGSVLNAADLARACATNATAFFILPNVFSANPSKDDTENIIRTLGIRRMAPNARIIVLLHLSQGRSMLKPTQLKGSVTSKSTRTIDVAGIDEFKLGLMGKTCEVEGFSTLICNLISTVGEVCDGTDPQWLQDYGKGMANEIYEVPLSERYAATDAVFGEIVLDCLERSENFNVYLIGLILQRDDTGSKRVIMNPGPWYKVESKAGLTTFGIFIAPDKDAVRQMEEGEVMKGRRVFSDQESKVMEPKKNNPEWTSPLLPEKENALRARQGQLDRLKAQFAEGNHPPEMPNEVSLHGGHILFCSSGMTSGADLGLRYFIHPLRPAFQKTEDLKPIVIMSSSIPSDWHTIAPSKKIYFIQGSPLSLFDLERASFRNAEVIVIAQAPGCIVTDDPYMADADTIFACKLIESELQTFDGANIPIVISELTFDMNYHYVPLPGESEKTYVDTGFMDLSLGGQKPLVPKKSVVLPGILGGMSQAKANVKTSPEETQSKLIFVPSDSKYFLQPRFACGRLFVSNVLTSLAVNTFYNPSLTQLVHAMHESKLKMVGVPNGWEGRPYFEYFEHLLFEKHLLPVAIFRGAIPQEQMTKAVKRRVATRPSAANQVFAMVGAKPPEVATLQDSAPEGFVFTAPAAKDVAISPNDKFFCFCEYS